MTRGTELDPELERELAEGNESQLPENLEGAPVGGPRSPRRVPRSGPEHNTEPATVAFEGSVETRATKDAEKQGISSRSSAAESEGQSKVTGERDGAQAGVNHSPKRVA
jgi:hypothetical protein